MRSGRLAVAAGTLAPAGAPGAAAIASPYWAKAQLIVLAMMAVVAVRIHEMFPGITVLKPVFTLTIVGIIMLWRRSSAVVRHGIARQPLTRLVFLYFLFIVVTIPFAYWRGEAFGTAKTLFPAILLVAAYHFCPPRRHVLDRLQFGYVIVVLFFSWYNQTFGGYWRGRLEGLSGTFDSNDIASILAMALPMALGMVPRTSGTREKIGALLAVFSLALGVIATGSRGGTLALLAGVLVFAFGLKGERGILLILGMVLAGTLAWYTAPPRFKARIRSLQNLENDYNLTEEMGRKAIWRRGRMYFSENPVIGVGAGNFEQAEALYNERVGRTGKWSAAHNAYIQAFAELGSIGGGLFMAIIITAGLIAFRMWRGSSPGGRAPPLHRPEYLGALAAYCAGAYFLSHAYFTPLFALVGLIAFADRTMAVEREGGLGEPAQVAAPAGPTRIRGQRGGLALNTPRLQSGGWLAQKAGDGRGGLSPRSLPNSP